MKSMFVLALGAFAFPASVSAQGGEPTCSHFGTATHGEHIIGDYVTGLGGAFPPDSLNWPPKGGEVGAAIRENGGVFIAGGPGPGFHFVTDPDGDGPYTSIAPGASSCLDTASPGIHFPPPE